jgi:hypothetical protein
MNTLYTATITPNSEPMEAVQVSNYLTYFSNYQPQKVAAATSDADKQRKKKHIITGAIGGKMQPNSKRSNSAMIGRDLLALDFDSIPREALFLKRIKLLGAQGVGYVLYKTFSYTPDNPRYRVLVPLDRLANEQEWRTVSVAVSKALGEYLDPAALTWSQIFLMPAETEHNAVNLLTIHDGSPVPVDKLLTNINKATIKNRHRTGRAGGIGYSGTRPQRSPGQNWTAAVFEWLAGGCSEGQRNTWATQALGYLVSYGVSGDALLVWADIINDSFITPPLPDMELETILRHVINAEQRKRGNAIEPKK